MKKKVVIAGTALGTGLLLTGCGFGGLVGPETEQVHSYDVAERVTQMEVESGSGDIVVTETDRTGIHVTETLRWRGDTKPETTHPVSGDRLSLGYECRRGGFAMCSVDYRVEVPKGLTLAVDTGSGNITLRAVTGPVTAKTGSGDIEGADFGAKTAVAETGSGSVDLAFKVTPESVDVKTGSGDATVRVPDGTYAVDADTGSGDESVQVRQDASSAHRLKLETGSGDVSVLKS